VDPFATRLRWWRRRRGLTQHALAARSGISRTSIARIELGRHDPALSMVRRLAKGLRVNIRKLVK
jgi:transcriptional regulator with XRE-family HTH domain